jgi:hypothetical protein
MVFFSFLLTGKECRPPDSPEGAVGMSKYNKITVVVKIHIPMTPAFKIDFECVSDAYCRA